MGAIAVMGLLLVKDVRREDPCVVDEPAWITASAETVRLVRHLAPLSEWDVAYDRLQLGLWGNENPPIGKFYFGTVIELIGWTSPINYQWRWGDSLEENVAAGRLPPFDLLTPVRLSVVLTAVIVLCLTYWLAFQLTRSPWAIAAPIYLFVLPVFHFHATHVYTDVPRLTFLLGSAVTLVHGLEESRTKWVFLSAMLAGLACATKFNSAPSVVAIVLAIGLRHTTWRARLLWMGAVPTIALATFVAVNPYLYRAPIQRTFDLVSSWHIGLADQQKEIAVGAVRSRPASAALVLVRGFVHPEISPDLDAWEPRPSNWIGAAFLLVLLGIVSVTRNLTSKNHAARVWALYGFALTVGTVLWLPFDWARYYLPVVILLPAVVAAGLRDLFEITARALRRPSRPIA